MNASYYNLDNFQSYRIANDKLGRKNLHVIRTHHCVVASSRPFTYHVEGRKCYKKPDIYAKVSFGPIVSAFVIHNKEGVVALALANVTEHGLTAAVLTENLQHGLRVAQQTQSGHDSIERYIWIPSTETNHSAMHMNTLTSHRRMEIPLII
ncbi:uncharacterized protein N7479_009974 [Penicillium vulpinum]|uniref:uncharacterized protein n=1 Tax=Penicillium vulpinum TaxID=29845 RepID=UPI002546F00F|nr:uncharacterized protein N7479_009974 [Penicillium vulpinum]KAJ5951561.1 hypothetical protein N7479_009974 [Penicillium vulpinum]